ncbi:hypothetical protein CXB51_031681 [Gossypium anomalum]|uniref:RNase H type-1 domain-containing protein n=1 Tax=Gossypium anomalum TaxID=47600 RepID=A0A8J5YC01_9ROSI|nr:hypothetical protein CXB51_031681 [Gossypium anomalum]
MSDACFGNDLVAYWRHERVSQPCATHGHVTWSCVPWGSPTILSQSRARPRHRVPEAHGLGTPKARFWEVVWFLNNFVFNPFMGEMLACLDSLRFATNMGFQNLVVERDSRSIIVRITDMGRDRSAIGYYVEEIKQRAKMFDKIIFRSVDTNMNQVAHILAKARSNFNEDRFWVEDVPDMAVLAVKADCPIPVVPD